MNRTDLSALRREYTQRGLSEKDVLPDPIEQFKVWLRDAVASGLREPNAMTLATVSETGAPAARVVLLKDVRGEGLVFYTNYESRKGREMARDNRVALLFLWTELERQVRIEGTAAKVAPEESEAYFRSRPTDSQLGAWTSPQSHVIPNRDYLEQKFEELRRFYEGRPIFCPPHWGGYCVTPESIEFWQGRPNRLHDRILFVRDGDRWIHRRLAP